MEQQERYDPVDCISQLDLLTMTILSGRLSGGWRVTLITERSRRQGSLRELVSYMPEPETPDFDAQDVNGYLTVVRRTNHEGPQVADAHNLSREKALAGKWAQWYINGPGASVVAQPDHVPDILTASLASNLYGVVVGARSAAVRSFQVNRNRLLRDRLGVEPYDDPIRNATQLPITGEDIAQVKAELDALPHRTSYPDFFGLGEAEQQVIVETVGKEWEAMVEILREHDFPPLTDRKAGQSPLAYLSPRTLRHAIANNPKINPADLCRAFIEVPHRFYGRVEELLEATRLLELRCRTSSGSGDDAPGEVKVLDGNRLDMVMLMRDPVVKPEIRSMELGDTVFLSRPAIGESKAEIIRPSQLSNIAEKNLEFLGRSLYDVLPGPKPERVKLVRWSNVDVAKALACQFFGSMTDLAMTVLPVSQEELQRRLPRTRFDAEDIYEVIFTVNMHSSGRAPAPAMLQLMLAIQKNTNIGSIAKTTWKPRSTGIDIAATLLRKSAEVAARVQAYNVRRKYLAGLPGAGKWS